jgi:hypothetical protein
MNRKKSIKKKKRTMLLFCMIACLAAPLSAQSLYEVATGARVASKTGGCTYNVTGSVFTVRNGQIIETVNGELREYPSIKYYRRVNYPQVSSDVFFSKKINMALYNGV